MNYYRLYFLANNKIRGVEELHAPDDQSAIEAARPFQDGSAMELWCQERRVHLFAPIEPVATQSANDSGSPEQHAARA